MINNNNATIQAQLDALKASITKIIGEHGEYTIEKISADGESYIKQFQISEKGQNFLIKALEGVHQVEEALGEYYADKYGF